MKLPAQRAGLPGNVIMIRWSAFLPAYLPTAGRQGGVSTDLPVRCSRVPKGRLS
jgi:hypothetical protein